MRTCRIRRSGTAYQSCSVPTRCNGSLRARRICITARYSSPVDRRRLCGAAKRVSSKSATSTVNAWCSAFEQGGGPRSRYSPESHAPRRAPSGLPVDATEDLSLSGDAPRLACRWTDHLEGDLGRRCAASTALSPDSALDMRLRSVRAVASTPANRPSVVKKPASRCSRSHSGFLCTTIQSRKCLVVILTELS